MSVLQGVVGLGLSDAWRWLQPKVISIGDFGDYVFFKFILDFLQKKIDQLSVDILGRMMTFVGMLAVVLLTIWIMVQGYRMVTGQLRESAAGLVINTARAALIVTVAVSFSIFGSNLTQFFTTDLKDAIHYVVTGEPGGPEDKIDENLGWMQVAMTSLDMLDTVGDPGLSDQKERNYMLIGIGSGGPAIVAGAMLLMYQVAMALFVGFGPLFILCLLFDFTKSLFQRWLFYGIGTLFSLAVLSAMTSIALDMVTRVAGAMWASSIAGNLILGQNSVGGISGIAMQQGGMGLILTTLILTIPPMAANFFQGTLGQFGAFATVGSQFRQGPPPGSPGQGGGYGAGGGGRGGYQPPPPSSNTAAADSGARTTGGFNNPATTPNYAAGGSGAGATAAADQVKSGSQLSQRNASTYASTGAYLPPSTPVPPELQSAPKTYGAGNRDNT